MFGKKDLKFNSRRLILDAVLVALYVVFAMLLSFKTPWFEVSLSSVPILLSAYIFGLKDALVIALFGSFIEQMLSFGLTLTTPLWILPFVIQALFAALCFKLAKKRAVGFVLAVVFSELVLTVLNTAALYADGYIMHYAVKALHLIAPVRLINGAVRAVISCIILPLIAPPLLKITERK